MTTALTTPGADDKPVPAMFYRAGKVCADSVSVAAYFERQHA